MMYGQSIFVLHEFKALLLPKEVPNKLCADAGAAVNLSHIVVTADAIALVTTTKTAALIVSVFETFKVHGL